MKKGSALVGHGMGQEEQRMWYRQINGLKAMGKGTHTYEACCDGMGTTKCCMTEMTSDPLPRIDAVLEVEPPASDCKSNAFAKTHGQCKNPEARGEPVKPNGGYQQLDHAMVVKTLSHFHSHALWPTHVSTAHLNVPAAFHEKLSRLAVVKYKQFTHEMTAGGTNQATALDVNNQFFNRQIKTEREVDSNPRSMAWWPEMYKDNQEWRALFKYTREACIQHILRNGRNNTREYLEGLQLIIWAAVYTTGTSHSTHMHEQSLCSGTYYSSAPPDSMPLILSDPRGGQPMHTDMGKPEAEPESPFLHQVHFFPKQGDMLMFPSYMPHSVPAATANSEPRVVWAYNLEGAGDSYARMSGVNV